MSRLIRHQSACAVLAAVMLVSVQTAYAQTTVATSFVIDSQLFKSSNNSQIIRGSEQRLTEELSAIAKKRFGFLGWQALSAEHQSTPTLIVTMRDIDNLNCTPAIRLHWHYKIDNQLIEISDIAQENLYKACSANPPVFEPDRLHLEVSAALERILANDANLEKVLTAFLSKISIADRLINYEDAMLLLPVSHDQLNASQESELRAKFKFAGQTTEPVPGSIEFQPRESFADGVQLFIRSIEVPRVEADLGENGDFWHPALAEVLRNSLDIRVTMISYQPSEEGSNTILDTSVLSEL